MLARCRLVGATMIARNIRSHARDNVESHTLDLHIIKMNLNLYWWSQVRIHSFPRVGTIFI